MDSLRILKVVTQTTILLFSILFSLKRFIDYVVLKLFFRHNYCLFGDNFTQNNPGDDVAQGHH